MEQYHGRWYAQFFGHQRFGFRLANLGRIVPFYKDVVKS